MNSSEFFEYINKEGSTSKFEGYLKLLDRILIWNMATMSLPKEDRIKLLNLWEKAIKRSIDSESNERTKQFEDTILGRLAAQKGEPDGEAYRLTALRDLEAAKFIANINLKQDPTEPTDDNEEIMDY
jgi:hypothetical protein